MAFRAAIAATLACLFVACGSPSSGGDDDGSSPDGSSPDAGVVETGINALVTSPAALTRSLFPTAVGLKWTYDVDPGTTTCSGGSRTIAVQRTSVDGGQTSFLVDHACDYYGPGSERIWIVGDAVHSMVATGATSIRLAVPLADGATWMVNSAVTADWKREPALVVVRAGTFDDCWTAHMLPWETWATYCRGVGMVRSTSVIGNGSTGFGVELTGYDFSGLH